jgi:hypothetical protein
VKLHHWSWRLFDVIRCFYIKDPRLRGSLCLRVTVGFRSRCRDHVPIQRSVHLLTLFCLHFLRKLELKNLHMAICCAACFFSAGDCRIGSRIRLEDWIQDPIGGLDPGSDPSIAERCKNIPTTQRTAWCAFPTHFPPFASSSSSVETFCLQIYKANL